MKSFSSSAKKRLVVILPIASGDESLLAHSLGSVAENLHHAESLVGCGSSEMLPIWEKSVGVAGLSAHLPVRFWALPSSDKDSPSFVDIPAIAARDYGGADILLLCPGVIVPREMDLRLMWGVAREENAATLSPTADSADFFSPVPDIPARQRPAAADIDRLVHAHGQREHYEIPCFNPACVYFPAASITLLARDAALFPRQNTWEDDAWFAARFLRQQGGCHLIADHIFAADLDTRRSSSLKTFFGLREEIEFVERVHPLIGLRAYLKGVFAGDSSQSVPLVPGIEDKPVQLHIMHSWGGGLSLWVRDYCRHDSGRHNLVLKSIGTWGAFGQSLALYNEYDHATPIKVWQLHSPILATTVANREYRQILASIIAEFGVAAIFVSSLIGHSLDALDSEIKTVCICHDYYPVCPSINIHFGSTCRQCDARRLALCIADNPLNRFFGNISADHWLAVRHHFQRLIVAHDIQMICPTPSVQPHMVALFPGLQEADFAVIPHGLDLPVIHSFPNPTGTERQKILILGSLAPHKGLALLQETIEAISRFADLYLVGCDKDGEIFAGYSGVTIIAGYNHPDLVDIVVDIAPDFALLLSIWPETFSYTLSELWHLRVVPIATNLGSFADRIRHGETGFLCEPDSASLLAMIKEVCRDAEKLAYVRKEIAKIPGRSCADMVRDYHRLLPLPASSASRYFWHRRKACALGSSLGGGSAILFLSNQETFVQTLIQMHEFLRVRVLSARGVQGWQKKTAAFCLRGIFTVFVRLARFLRRG